MTNKIAPEQSRQRSKKRVLPPPVARATGDREEIARKLALWLTVDEAVDRLGCYTEEAVRVMMRRGTLRAERIRYRLFIEPESVEAFMESEQYRRHAAICA